MIFDIIKRAKELFYDNTESNLEATNVQDAVDEVSTNLGNLIKSKNIKVTPNPNSNVSPFTHYANINLDNEGIQSSSIISLVVKGASTSGAIAFVGVTLNEIHIHANNNAQREIKIKYI